MIEMEERKRLSDVDERSYSENSFPGLNDETQSEETVLKDDLLVKITKTLGRWGLEVNGYVIAAPHVVCHSSFRNEGLIQSHRRKEVTLGCIRYFSCGSPRTRTF